MELLLRLDGCGGATPQRDVAVAVDGRHTVADLARALGPMAGRGDPFRLHRTATGEVLGDSDELATVGLRSGELLRLVGPSADSTPRPARRGTQLSVISGADSGRSQLLGPGTYLVGRAPSSDIVLADVQVSKQHAQVHITAEDDAYVTAGSSTNPTLVNGHVVPAGTHTPVGPEDVIQMGATTLGLRPTKATVPVGRDRLGHVPFHRTPHQPVDIPTATFPSLGNVPAKPEVRGFSILTILAPIAAGVMLALLLQNPRFLIFTLLSPIMAVVHHRQHNSQAAQRHRAAVERFRTRIARRHEEVRAGLDAERVARLRRTPDLADLAQRALEPRRDLWSRGREYDDFLYLRVGSGDVPSQVTIKPDEGGDEELLEELRGPLEGHDVIRGVPVGVPLAQLGVAALVGGRDITDDVAASLLLQAVTLHSPEELVVLAAVHPDRTLLDWLKWVPHTRSATSPLAGEHLTDQVDAGEQLLRRILDVAERRTQTATRDADPRWPWLLLVVDKDLELDTPLMTTLLQHCPSAGISVVWLTDDERRVRREARAVVDCRPAHESSTVWTAGSPGLQPLDLDRVSLDIATDVACALAPLRDASSVAASSGIPRIVPLFDALGVEDMTPRWVAEQWLAARSYALPAPVGIGPDGPLVLDLVEHGHGPHALIAGTSGSGKSELLMSIVGGLVARTPPNRLNLLFVDYKGGAASDVFAGLPHTVGRVTNLNAALARRALVSLRAELNRRMDVMRGKAKDLEQMLAEHPDEAPPSLVIVLDEFATLVKEIPEFMEGIVDIAQRGRSLGIHLILSTQRPQGAVNDNILANTNLRICLRMLDGAESSQIIGTPDAATIPVPLKGRAFARLGPGQLEAFQSAFTGAPLLGRVGPSRVEVQPFRAGVPIAFESDTATGEATGGTQLDALLAAVRQAADDLKIGEEGRRRRPWRDELARAIPLADVRTQVTRDATTIVPGRHLTLGMLDDPASQSQYPAVVDLEEGGGLVVFGTGGSGKTTLLQTAAAAAAADDADLGGGQLTIVALDFSAGALTALQRLPQCPVVATWDDLEGVTRLLARLQVEIDRRRRLLHPGDDGQPTTWDGDRVLVLVDGYGTMVEILEGKKLYRWVDVMSRIVMDGRQVGLHVVLAADQRQAVKGSLLAAFSNRLVLRQADEADYVLVGIPAKLAKGLVLPPGRGFLNGDRTIQIAQPGEPPPLDEAGSAPVEIPALPDAVALQADPPGQPLHAHLGVADVTLTPMVADLSRFDLLITGPPGSGRSTALATIARQIAAGGCEVRVFGTADSPLRHLDGMTEGVFDEAKEVKERMVSLIGEIKATRGQTDPPTPVLVVVDDIDMLEEALGHQGLPGELLGTRGVRVVAAAGGGMALGASLFSSLHRRVRSRLYLQPANADEARGHFPQLSAALRPGLAMPVGRGIFVQSAIEAQTVQVADGLAAQRPPLVGEGTG